MSKSTKLEMEPSNIMPITLEDLDGEACKIMEEQIKAFTQEMLMRSCTNTHQGVVLKPGPLPKATFDAVSTEDVAIPIKNS